MDGELTQFHGNLADGHAAGPEIFDALSLHRSRAVHQDSTHVNSHASGIPAVTGRCWCISKGMAGMNSQTAGLASAVGYEPLEKCNAGEFSNATGYEFINTRMAFPWNCLPFSLIPSSGRVLRQPKYLEASPQPRLVVSCGRHGVVPALYLKKKTWAKNIHRSHSGSEVRHVRVRYGTDTEARPDSRPQRLPDDGRAAQSDAREVASGL